MPFQSAERFSDAVSRALNSNWSSLEDSSVDTLKRALSPESLASEDLACLHNFVQSLKPINALEVGLAVGSSASCTLLAGAPHLKNLIVMDPFQTQGYARKGLQNAITANKGNAKIEFYEAFSYNVLPALLSQNIKIDFSFIDGSHQFDETLIELFFVDKMMQVGGVIVLDDRVWPMVGSVVAFAQTNYKHFVIDQRHPRLTFIYKQDVDKRRWFDFWRFEVPESAKYFQKIKDLQGA